MTPREAAKVLGTTVDAVRAMQASGTLPTPIPDDYLDPVIDFRVRIEQAFRRKVDARRAADRAGADG